MHRQHNQHVRFPSEYDVNVIPIEEIGIVELVVNQSVQ